MAKCVKCSVEVDDGNGIKNCLKCGTCYTEEEKGEGIHSNVKSDEYVFK
ncbi:hypothetical protein ACFL1L_04590 [Thermoplasmatota archaeon]